MSKMRALLESFKFKTRDEDKTKAQIYTTFFAVLGVISGIVMVTLGVKISNLSVESVDQERTKPIGLSTESAGVFDISHVSGYGLPLTVVGSVLLFIGSVGLFAIWSEMFLSMCIYSALCFLGTLSATPIIIFRLATFAEFRSDLSRYLRTAWLAVAFTHPSLTTNFERNNQCCGWYNVFDYCTTKYMSGKWSKFAGEISGRIF